MTPAAMLGRVSELVTTATFRARPIDSAIAVQLAIIACCPAAKLAALLQVSTQASF
jgi:hypothetical protein